MSFVNCIAVDVKIKTSAYEAVEGNSGRKSIVISLVISGKSSTDITVQVQASGVTATGENRIL